MAYIVMDCLGTRIGGEKGLLITVLEYETDDPIVLTGAKNFQEAEDFIEYLKEANKRGFTIMYTEQESFDNFSMDELIKIKSHLSLKYY